MDRKEIIKAIKIYKERYYIPFIYWTDFLGISNKTFSHWITGNKNIPVKYVETLEKEVKRVAKIIEFAENLEK